MRKRGLAVMAAVLLAGCGNSGPDRDGRTSWDVRNAPVPVPFPKKRPGSFRSPAQKPAPAQIPATLSSGTVTVAAGDTLFALSRRHKADVQSIIRANGLEPPFVLTVGQRLRIPAEPTHVVQKGETGYGISRAYGVDLATLARVNGLEPPYQVNVGQRLLLPGADSGANSGAGSETQTTAATPTVRPKAVMSAPRSLAAIPPAATANAVPIAQSPQAQSPLEPSSGFIWPARGKILSSYGPKPKGLHNDGINIARPAGSLFHAADSGVIVYAGNDIKAYGNLILLRHQDGWITAYAHAEQLLVKRGDSVERGQALGRVGSTGNVTSPQLHFEIRQGRRTIDPASQLPG